jgi:hypothetical protein
MWSNVQLYLPKIDRINIFAQSKTYTEFTVF